MGNIFKTIIILWVSICGISSIEVGWSEEMSKEEIFKSFGELKLKYTQGVDPLRYRCLTKTGRFTDYKSSPSIGCYMYSLAGAVYGRVEKTQPIDDPPSTLIYIKPYRLFKDIITDSNGYVVVREFAYGGTSYIEIAGTDKFQVGETVLVFLDDIPDKCIKYRSPAGFAADSTKVRRIKKILSLGSLTPGKGYYYERTFGTWSVKHDTLVFKHPGGMLKASVIPPRKIPFQKAIKIMEQIEKEYKEAKSVKEEE